MKVTNLRINIFLYDKINRAMQKDTIHSREFCIRKLRKNNRLGSREITISYVRLYPQVGLSDFLPCPILRHWLVTGFSWPSSRSIVCAANTTRRKRSLVPARSYGQGESKYRLHCYENEISSRITFH